MLPRIKPRASYFSEPCKLPLLAPPGSAPSGSVRGGIDDDMGQSGGRKDRKRGGGGRSAGSEVRGSVCGSALDAVSGGVRVPISGKAGRLDGGGGGEEGRGKRRSIAGSGRSGNEDRPPRREEEVAPKEGGGGETHYRMVLQSLASSVHQPLGPCTPPEKLPALIFEEKNMQASRNHHVGRATVCKIK